MAILFVAETEIGAAAGWRAGVNTESSPHLDAGSITIIPTRIKTDTPTTKEVFLF
jgi:hypothetical protein